MADRSGQQFGNYRLVALLGQGGYAEVYLGQHVRLELQAAIKVLHTHLTEQEAQHFQQEAQTIAKLTHPAIVRVFDFDVQDGVPFLVMDYAPGGSLRRRYPKGTVVPLPQIISHVRQVAAALQYAHDHKFIHRDVKPENMLVGRNEEVLLSDFGLAALAHSSGSLSTQEAIGTLSYMAPEQIEGHPRPASDQYALAVVVYEWLCGSRPFEGSATEVMVQQLSMPPPPLHEKVATIPLGIEQVVLKALAKEPKARFASVHDFATALEQASELAPAAAMRPVSESPAPDPDAATSYATMVEALNPAAPTEEMTEAPQPVEVSEPTVSADSPPASDLDTPQGHTAAETPVPGQMVAPTPLEPAIPLHRRAALLIGLVVVVVAAAVLGSLSLLAHFGVLGARSAPPALQVARGGTLSVAPGTPGSLIPNGQGAETEMMDALYLPLFSGDAQGVIHAVAATIGADLRNKEETSKTWPPCEKVEGEPIPIAFSGGPMSSKPYHSNALPSLQEVDLNDAAWNEVVKSRLPADLEVQARHLQAWSRQREVRSVSDLLRALLVYACCQYSFRELGMWAVLKGIGSLCERAWRKRLEQSQLWIAWLLSEVLGVHQTPGWLPAGQGRVLVIDATRFKTPAGSGDDVRLHQSYDLRAGRMEQVQVTDRHQAESLAHFELRAGDLVVTDAGYAVGSSVEQTQQSHSFLLQRTAASQLHLENEQGRTIHLKERIKHVAANCLKEVVGWVNLPESGERARVRVLCYRLPKEQADKARERKAAKLRKKHGPKYNQELVWWAGWVILVSTTDAAQWSGRELVALYRARWQIELFFKRLKQGLRLHQLRLADFARVSCVLHLNLIGWWLQEEEAQWMREVLTSVLKPLADDLREVSEPTEGGEQPEAGAWILSSWTVAHFCCEQVRTMLRGAWTHQRIVQCQQALQRYVRSRKRNRGHRETEQRAWLQRRGSPPAQAARA